MILRINSKVDKNGNSYGLIIDTDKKTYKSGYAVCAWDIDLHASKTEIKQLIDYNLKPNGFKAVNDI